MAVASGEVIVAVDRDRLSSYDGHGLDALSFCEPSGV